MKVEIPVEKVTHGAVAVIVDSKGNATLVPTSVVTENGVELKLNGDTNVKSSTMPRRLWMSLSAAPSTMRLPP